MPTRLLLLLLVAVPVADLVLLGRLVTEIGLGPTLLAVFASGWVGFAIVRREGVALLAAGADESAVVWRLLGVVAGGLLLMPGLLTDVLGLVLVLSAVRRRVAPWLASRLNVRAVGGFDVPSAGEPRIRVGEPPPNAASRPRPNPFSTPFD